MKKMNIDGTDNTLSVQNISTRLKIAALAVWLAMGAISFSSCGRDSGIDPETAKADTTYYSDMANLDQVITIRDNAKQNDSKPFETSFLNNARLGIKAAEMARLPALLELIGLGNVKFAANDAALFPGDSIRLDEAQAKVIVELWNKGIRFIKGDGRNAFFITTSMDNLFTPEMLRELMYADARTLDIQTAANIDAVVASALELAKAGNKVVVNFAGVGGNLSIPAEKLSEFRPIVPGAKGANSDIAANVAFAQAHGLTVTVDVDKDQTSAYPLNTRALMGLSQPWALNLVGNATAIGGVNNIVGYEHDDKNIGLDTMLYNTKFPNIDQTVGTYVYTATYTPVMGYWSNTTNDITAFDDMVTLDGRPVTDQIRANIPRLQIGPGCDNSYLKMCVMYNTVNDGKDGPYDFKFMNTVGPIGLEILPDKDCTTEYSLLLGGGRYMAYNIASADILYHYDNGFPYARRVLYGAGNTPFYYIGSFHSQGKIKLKLPGYTTVLFSIEDGIMYSIGGQRITDGPVNLKIRLELHGITVENLVNNSPEALCPSGYSPETHGKQKTYQFDYSDFAPTHAR